MFDFVLDFGFKWVKEFIILGINFMVDLVFIINNFEEKLGEVNFIFNKW